MSKRKYAEDVSGIVYAGRNLDETLAGWTDPWMPGLRSVPARVVSEAFYRRLVKDFELCQLERALREVK